ncbi:reverse transcriptase domain-containing protein [Tanacetum coccineum]
MEKLVLALVHASKHLKRVSVKGKILADFIVERPKEESPDTLMGEEEELPEPWILFTDRSSCTDGSEAGLILTNPKGMEFTYALRFRFDVTNNEAEYESLIAGLKITKQIGLKNLQTNVDSRLVANQVNGEHMLQKKPTWFDIWKSASGGTKGKVDKYSGSFGSIKRRRGYMNDSHLQIPHGWNIASRSEKSENRPLQANYVLREIHEGSCSMHASTRSVVAKALRIGYYLPTMHEDARKLIRACQDCQVHKPVSRSPQQKLSPITSPWPFYKWGIDIAGPFPEGPRKVKFLIVAIDYFTKWIKAKPVATITRNQIKKFVWDNIVCRFGLPEEIISDNGKQFEDNPFKD